MDGKIDRSKIVGGVGLIAGFWLILSALSMGLGAMSNLFLVGVLVALFSLIELFRTESAMWVSWVNGILGLWLLLSPLFYVGMAVGEKWNSIVLGVIILATSIWGAMSSTMGMGHPKAR